MLCFHNLNSYELTSNRYLLSSFRLVLASYVSPTFFEILLWRRWTWLFHLSFTFSKTSKKSMLLIASITDLSILNTRSLNNMLSYLFCSTYGKRVNLLIYSLLTLTNFLIDQFFILTIKLVLILIPVELCTYPYPMTFRTLITIIGYYFLLSR